MRLPSTSRTSSASPATLLGELRAALVALHSARPQLAQQLPRRGAVPGWALVRKGSVELVSAARADSLRAQAPADDALLLVELGAGTSVRRMTFLVSPSRVARRPGRDGAGSRTPRGPTPTG